MPQGSTAPQLRQSRTTSPPIAMDTNHVPRTPTPPIRTEGLVTNMPTRPQSPSLPNQRHDVMFPNVRLSPQPSNIQLPIRPQANLGPVPRPSGMTASEFLGSLVGSKLPGIPSDPSNLVPSSVPTTSSSPSQKVVGARLPDLVAGSAGQVVTSSPKTDGLPTARMPDVVSGVTSTASRDKLPGSCDATNASDRCDVDQSKETDKSTPTKGFQSVKISEASVTVSSQQLPIVMKKDLIVNGTVEEPSVLNAKAAVVDTSQAKLAAVNG